MKLKLVKFLAKLGVLGHLLGGTGTMSVHYNRRLL